jgi:hypothetical protein
VTEEKPKPPSPWAPLATALFEALTVGFVVAGIVAIVYINVRW